MATRIAHLRIADAVLEAFPALSPVHYVMGSIASDSGLPSPNGRGFYRPKVCRITRVQTQPAEPL